MGTIIIIIYIGINIFPSIRSLTNLLFGISLLGGFIGWIWGGKPGIRLGIVLLSANLVFWWFYFPEIVINQWTSNLILFVIIPLSGYLGGYISNLYLDYQAATDRLEDFRENRSLFRNLVELAGDIVFLIGKRGQIEYINPLGEKYTGYSNSELVSMQFMDLVHPDHIREVNEFFLEMKKLKIPESSIEFRVISKNGDVFWMEQTTSLLKDHGEVTGLQCICRDVTTRRAVEQTLKSAHEKETSANKMKSRVLATISHDIRTPLNAVMGYTSMLISKSFGDINPKQEEFLTRILASTQQMNNLITNLLYQSEKEGATLSLRIDDFEPIEILKATENMLIGYADSKDISLITKLDDELPYNLTGDQQRIQQIVLNLTHNAIKFTRVGKILVYFKKINKDLWAIEVSDTGPGIPLAQQSEIFVPFNKIETSANRLSKGTGLGLSIVDEFTKLMGGEIQLESEENVGTTFRIILPMRIYSDELSPSQNIVI